MSTTVEELAARVARLEENMSRIRDLRLDGWWNDDLP